MNGVIQNCSHYTWDQMVGIWDVSRHMTYAEKMPDVIFFKVGSDSNWKTYYISDLSSYNFHVSTLLEGHTLTLNA